MGMGVVGRQVSLLACGNHLSGAGRMDRNGDQKGMCRGDLTRMGKGDLKAG